MADKKFARLEKACGGAINPETLTEFAKTVREYEEFMEMGRRMFAPADDGDTLH